MYSRHRKKRHILLQDSYDESPSAVSKALLNFGYSKFLPHILSAWEYKKLFLLYFSLIPQSHPRIDTWKRKTVSPMIPYHSHIISLFFFIKKTHFQTMLFQKFLCLVNVQMISDCKLYNGIFLPSGIKFFVSGRLQ